MIRGSLWPYLTHRSASSSVQKEQRRVPETALAVAAAAAATLAVGFSSCSVVMREMRRSDAGLGDDDVFRRLLSVALGFRLR